jgi:hypothetical protein
MCHTPNGNIWHNLDDSTKEHLSTRRMILQRRRLAGEGGGAVVALGLRSGCRNDSPLDSQAVGLPSVQACGQFLLG